MAFIREYMAEAGDPFKLRLPKALRKFKPGKFLKKALPIASAFVPGLQPFGIAGNIASRLARRKGPLGLVGSVGSSALEGLQAAAEASGVPPETLIGFARSYGYDVGDPAPPPSKKRKTAGAGPKAKAARKRVQRAAKMPAPAPTKGGGIDWGAIAAGASQILPHVLGGVRGIGLGKGGVPTIPDLSGFAFPGSYGGSLGKAGSPFGRRRRTMNPANVKALRRSVRRVEGFEKLVSRVHKMMPRLRASSRPRPCTPKKRGR